MKVNHNRSKYNIGQRVFVSGYSHYGVITEVLDTESGFKYFIKCDDGSERISVPEDNIYPFRPYARYSYF